MKPFGQINYEAYCEDRRWRSFSGEALPAWNAQTAELQTAWEAAAQAVLFERHQRELAARRNNFA